MSDFFRFAEHLISDCFDPIPDGEPGTFGDPYTHAPANWLEDTLPYGAWCLCHECGLIGRSTNVFDYFADKPGLPLTCQTCVYNKAVGIKPKSKKRKA